MRVQPRESVALPGALPQVPAVTGSGVTVARCRGTGCGAAATRRPRSEPPSFPASGRLVLCPRIKCLGPRVTTAVRVRRCHLSRIPRATLCHHTHRLPRRRLATAHLFSMSVILLF